MRILLVTSRETHRWIIPKGWPEPNMTPYEAAANEALEEAGVIGVIEKEPSGSYTYAKLLKSGETVICDVQIFLLAVEKELPEWRESHERQRRWTNPAEAALLVMEGELVSFILRLGAPA